MDRSHVRTVRHRLGVAFELWTDQRAWFWCLVDPGRSGRITIGAAAGESAAISDACALIVELAEARRAADRLPPQGPEFEATLASLERYLTSQAGART